jgi:hypothetical protein
MPILTIELRGSRRGVVLSGRVLIGRWRGCGVPVGHQSVSRLHAWVDRQATGEYYIADADSRSGTSVNGQPIDGHYVLRDGDLIAIGPAKLTYSLASTLPAEFTPLQVAFSGASRAATTSGILFACTCGAPLWVTSDLAGRQGRCRFCKKLVQIPRASVVPPAQMSSKSPPKAAATIDVAKPAPTKDAAKPAPPIKSRPAAPTPKPVDPASLPLAPPVDLIRLDEEDDIVDVDSRPANEAAAGHRTFTGFNLPPDAAKILPPDSVPEAVGRRPFPTPRPRDAANDLSLDYRTDLPGEPEITLPPAASAPTPPSRPAVPTGSSKSITQSPPKAKPVQPAKAIALAKAHAAETQHPAKPPSTREPRPSARDTAVWDTDAPIVARTDADAIESAEPGAPARPRPAAVSIPAPSISDQRDSFASLSLNADDSEGFSTPVGERPTGLLTSGVATSTPSDPPAVLVEPPDFPHVPEPASDVETPVDEIAESAFAGESADPPANQPVSIPHVEPQLAESDAKETPAALETPADAVPVESTVSQPQAKQAASSGSPVPMPPPNPTVLVCVSIVFWVLSAFTFGIPSLAVAGYSLNVLRRRDGRVPAYVLATLIAIAGVVTGVAASSAWWLSKPLFHWKAW